MNPMNAADAAHAAVLARAATAEARATAAAAELRQALTDVEALARLSSRSAGEPIAVFVPPVGNTGDLTFVISVAAIRAAMTRLVDSDVPLTRTATILSFPN